MDITQTKLAEIAGVSQYTVHRALHGMSGVSDKTRDRIHSLASEYGYRLNTAARTMRTGRTGQVGVLMLDNPERRYVHPALFELTWGVNAGLEAAGYVTTLVRLVDLDRPDADESRIFREHLLDGIVVTNLLPDRILEKIEKMVRTLIWLDTNTWKPHDCLQRDEEAAGRMATRALIDAGHTRILHFVRRVFPAQFLNLTHYSAAARINGAKAEAAAAGVEMIGVDVNEWSEFDVRVIEPFLRDGAGVLITRLSDARRLLALVAGRLKVNWGIDYSIASADDAADLDWWWPELARVRFDRLAMGNAAAEMMVAKLNGDLDGTISRRVTGPFLKWPNSTIRPR